ncbi:MAG TPA: hypothetical protein PK264_10810 [Hyphomicrobiaceae bacterium]|nr:hypothetical protein [Hyphomicrobiaceae bacterium]
MRRLPGIVSFILRSAAIGAGLGAGLLALFLATNTGGMRALILESSDPMAPILLLLLGFMTLVGSLYSGAAVMTLPRDERDAIWTHIRKEPSF